MFLYSLSYRNVTNCISKIHIVSKSLTRNSKYRYPVLYQSFHSSPRCSLKVNNIRACNKQIKSNLLDVNTNIQNNVILYKNEHMRGSRILKILFIGWTFGCTIIAYYAYSPTYISTWSQSLSWMEYLRTNGTNLACFAYVVIMGPPAWLLLYALNHRFVKYIILHKGGQNVSVITNHLYKHHNTFKLPVDEVKTVVARSQMINYLPLKIRGKKFYYIVDSDGKFLNGHLFDYTIGTKKSW